MRLDHINQPVNKKSWEIVMVALTASILVSLRFITNFNIDINLADEGYLWYGAWRTSLGEVPMLDFQSYDPGRYYWSAFWFKVLGPGLVTLRAAGALLQVIGLTLGLLALRRVIRSWGVLTIAGIVLLVWMFPSHKVFESSISMAAVYFAVLLAEKPSLRRHFISGVFVGLAAFFGRNHGLYGFVSFSLIIVIAWYKTGKTDLLRKIIIWLAGIFAGYLPMLLMFALIPGFFDAFLKTTIFRVRNIPSAYIPVSWPWQGHQIRSFLKGALFLLIPVFYLVQIALSLMSEGFTPLRRLLTASAIVGIAYMHHAFARAEFGHLAQSIHPFLISILALVLASKRRGLKFSGPALLILVCIISYFVVRGSPVHRKNEIFIKAHIAGDDIWVYENTAGLIDATEKINSELVKPDEGFFIAPNMPALYAIMQRRSPTWDLYFFFRPEEAHQEEIISELEEKNVNWILLGDLPYDGRDDLRFSNTHSRVWQHIMYRFEPVRAEGIPDHLRLLHRKGD